MIYSINGEVTCLGQNTIVVECGGVGFECRATAQAVSRANIGEKLKLYTYMNVREDAMELYGFADESERNCFKKLISVSGVGCKVAVDILSSLSPQEFALAVVSDDAKTITRVKGIGSKTAQRIILELKDKLEKDSSFETVGIPKVNIGALGSNAFSEAHTALMVLGFTNAQAQAALEGLDSGLTVQELVKEGLKRLNNL
ncbi:MAG: Holliday junction branch migration protein RuvA [Ruminiclostridium sp.]|nr:Holliday junction branch migration protein RuvA [Ruminiclostridium sp.]